MRIHTEVDVDVTPSRAWAALADFADHVHWMRDAETIRFVGPKRTGVGTTFDCETRIGPFKTTDRMTVTEWDDKHWVGVHHKGAFTGEGSFEIEALGPSRVRISWTEELYFPWYFAFQLGEFVAKPILTSMWKGNLEQLKDRLEIHTA